MIDKFDIQGVIIGLMHSNEDLMIAQLILMILVQVLYMVAVIAVKPLYLDPTHKLMDIVVTICNVIVIGFMFAFLPDTNASYVVKAVFSALR
jgi:glucan phosphoethanolaminetransferase (alkaline phosphatase superfamily)